MTSFVSAQSTGTCPVLPVYSMVSGGGLVVAFGFSEANYAVSSDEGENWTTYTNPLGTTPVGSIQWNGSYFLIVTSDQTTVEYAKSSDGVNWTTGTVGTTAWAAKGQLAWSGSRWAVVVGGGPAKIATSTDGTTWSTNTFGTSAPDDLSTFPHAITWDGTQFVVQGENWNSDERQVWAGGANGTSWTKVATIAWWNTQGLIYSGGFYMMYGSSNPWVSSNLTSWQRLTTGAGASITLGSAYTVLAIAGTLLYSYMGGSTPPTFMESTDGATWAEASITPSLNGSSYTAPIADNSTATQNFVADNSGHLIKISLPGGGGGGGGSTGGTGGEATAITGRGLVKDSRVLTLPGSPGTANAPAQTSTPAYTSLESRVVCGYKYSGGSPQWVTVTNPDGTTEVQYTLVPSGSSGSGYQTVTASYSCTTEYEPVNHPAEVFTEASDPVAPSASSTVTDFNIGWNSGARSITSFPGDGFAQFTVPMAVTGVMAGLNTEDTGTGFTEIPYAFYISNGKFAVFERGVQATMVAGLFGTHAPEKVYRIERRRNAVKYYADGVLMYESSVPSSLPMFLDASLYTAGDSVETPSIGPLVGAGANSTTGARWFDASSGSWVAAPDTLDSSLYFEPLQVSAGEGAYLAQAYVVMAPMTMESRPLRGGVQTLLPMTMLAADSQVGVATLQFAPMTLEVSSGQFVPTYALASLPMLWMAGSAVGTTGAVGSASLTFPPLALLSGRDGYGEGRVSMAPAIMYAHAYDGNTSGSLMTLSLAQDLLSYLAFVDVSLPSNAVLSGDMFVLVIKDAAVSSTATATHSFTPNATLDALMRIDVNVFAGIPVLTEAGEVWVMNDETGASSQYENFSFNSFGKYKGQYLGAKADGVYLMGGEADVAAPIRSSISLGTQDFGTTLAKSVTNCYLGVASSGNVYLKVTAGGQTYLYKTAESTSYMDTQRIPVGRGLRANYITFELYNEAGADFELASVEFQAATLTRRI